MPVYEYKALDRRGKNLKGIIEADSESQARAKLRSGGRYPVSLKQSRVKAESTSQTWFSTSLFNRISSEEVYVITRQLATLHGAGIPLDAALSSLVDQTRNTALKKVMAQIKGKVSEGKTLAQSMGEHPKLFPHIFINMIRAGEESGSLSVVLEQLADFSEKQQALKGRLRAALYYPVFMAIIGTAILFILITYIVPNITQVFKDMEQTLPLPTLFLIGISSFLKNYWWAMLGGVLVVVMLFRMFINTVRGRSLWDLVKLRTPIIGPVAQKIILARFASTLASLNHSGVEFMVAMRIVRTLVNNVRIAEVVDAAMEHVQRGQSMTVALAASPWFPPMFVQMIAVGEQSGSLEVMLNKIADAYERDVETAVKGMTSLLEPMMITVMGLAVGFIVISILLPIFEMNQMIH
jgi:general secretion pathway protein F